MKIGILAGTIVDTQMGVDFVLSKGHSALGRACSSDPVTQCEMQILRKAELLQISINLCKEMVLEGVEGIFVNCNSLSGAIDMNVVRQNISVPLVTPLDVYALYASSHSCLGIIAANCQSLAAIEHVIMQKNKDCMVFGAGILPLVVAIENAIPPQKIYADFKIKGLVDSLTALGCEALILGCTHFPYILSCIEENISVPVINPGDKMLELLVK